MRTWCLLLLVAGAVACTTDDKRLVLSWDPVSTDQKGRPIEGVSYEVFVQVNDEPEQRFGPVFEPRVELPVRVEQCDQVRVQVVSIHQGERSPRSLLLEERVPAEPRPGCTQAARGPESDCPGEMSALLV